MDRQVFRRKGVRGIKNYDYNIWMRKRIHGIGAMRLNVSGAGWTAGEAGRRARCSPKQWIKLPKAIFGDKLCRVHSIPDGGCLPDCTRAKPFEATSCGRDNWLTHVNGRIRLIIHLSTGFACLTNGVNTRRRIAPHARLAGTVATADSTWEQKLMA